MNAVQNSQLQMFAAVKVTCDAHNAAWSGLPLFADAYDDFLTLLPDTVAAGALQSTSSKGTTLAKNALRATLEAKLLQIAAALVGYGITHNDGTLAADAKTTPSDLHNVGDEKLVFRSEKLLSFATPLADDALVPFGVADSFVAAAEADQDLFLAAIGKPRHVIGEAKRGTQDLAVAIGGLNAILKTRMDPGGEVLQYTQPAFYSEYISAREIVDAGTSTPDLRVTVTSTVPGNPALEGVGTLINPGGIPGATNGSGVYILSSLDAGGYTLALSLDGYAPALVPFSIVDGEPTVLEVQMGPG